MSLHAVDLSRAKLKNISRSNYILTLGLFPTKFINLN